ncbi:MAG: type I glutamate--ammonia ligase [Chloroflexi bacterium]|nr:MAG: type I glutamate--ammonia ligase [Chloroflexota bacterium]MBL1193794.1 type I glutamate--ammonia ligase [Chloroflexota bacterium]NOH11087.1 type I glutamate--ammonia ligase [Chloroflexota bacterium]
MVAPKIPALEEFAQLTGSKNGTGTFSPDIERCTTAKEVLAYAEKRNLSIVDFKFIDLLGRWHHFAMPIHALEESMFVDGLGFDGSSIRAFQDIHESDMILMPDPTTAVVDPVAELPTLSLICSILDPLTREPYTKDPRYVAAKAEKYLIDSGIADTSFWGPEAEFFVFDGVQFDYQVGQAFYRIESNMAHWESSRGYDDRYGANLGYRPEIKRGYYRVPPVDALNDWRSEAILRLLAAGIDVEVHHGEVGSGGQVEIDLKYGELTQMADVMMMYKYILKNTAAAHGKTVTFMPKPMFEDNGSGMHTHQSLWKGGKNLFFDADGYASTSETARYYIGGIIKHTPALLALVAPTTNSYKRLVPGYEAPVMMAYSRRNRSACIRIPVYLNTESAVRVEYRSPDPSANPYLAFAAMLMAGLDGIKNKIDPGEPMDIDLYEDDAPEVEQVPGSLEEVLDALEADHDFLLEGDVFTKDLIEAYINWKRVNEADAVRMRPHPYEYLLYYDA